MSPEGIERAHSVPLGRGTTESSEVIALAKEFAAGGGPPRVRGACPPYASGGGNTCCPSDRYSSCAGEA